MDRRRFLQAGGGLALGGSALALMASGGSAGAAKTLQLSNDKASWKPFFQAEANAQKKAVGINWKMNEFADTNTYQAAIRTSGATSKVPDLYTWWSGFLMKDVVQAGFAADVSKVWDEYHSAYDPGLRKVFTFNGKTYGAPLYFGYWATLYSIPTFKKYNLQPPKTWNDLVTVCDTLKKNGVTPFAATIQGVWPGFIYWQELMIRTDPELYTAVCAGKAKYTDSGVLKVMNMWGDWIKAGYFSNPSATNLGTGSDNVIPQLKQGKIGMVQIGTWYEATMVADGMKPGTDYGGFIWPNAKSGIGNHVIFESGPMVAAAHGPNKSEAVKSLHWFMSKAGQQHWNKVTGFTSARKDVPSSSSVDVDLAKTVKAGHYKQLNRYWEGTPNQIANDACNEFDKFMLHPQGAGSILSAIQNQAASVWAQQ
ncbi:MAG: extracellular solute-binding protein [Candidatus Dormibacteraeota bacterium]|nr:extracellular solute-binding protein [Candidatus Dormibacteraeota bacterium]